jgi:hypothetical protein
MGAFNILKAATTCPVCRQAGTFEVQFKYGDTYQFKYTLGDQLKWGGNDIGVPGAKKVLVQALGGPCPNCGEDYLDFDILAEADRIVALKPVGKNRPDSTPEGFVILKN